MKKADIVWMVGSVYAGATAFFYCWPRWFSLKLPRYYPVEHTWKWGGREGAISQGWYGMQGFAFLAAGIVALVTYIILKKAVKGDLKPRTIKITGMATCAVIILCMAYILYFEFDKWQIL